MGLGGGREENRKARLAVDQIVARTAEPEASHRQAVDEPQARKLQHNTARQTRDRRALPCIFPTPWNRISANDASAT